MRDLASNQRFIKKDLGYDLPAEHFVRKAHISQVFQKFPPTGISLFQHTSTFHSFMFVYIFSTVLGIFAKFTQN